MQRRSREGEEGPTATFSLLFNLTETSVAPAVALHRLGGGESRQKRGSGEGAK
jgi:hypothetical protein